MNYFNIETYQVVKQIHIKVKLL